MVIIKELHPQNFRHIGVLLIRESYWLYQVLYCCLGIGPITLDQLPRKILWHSIWNWRIAFSLQMWQTKRIICNSSSSYIRIMETYHSLLTIANINRINAYQRLQKNIVNYIVCPVLSTQKWNFQVVRISISFEVKQLFSANHMLTNS